MPRHYLSILLLGIVTISAVCLGLRWRVLAQLPERTYTPMVTAQEPAPARSYANPATTGHRIDSSPTKAPGIAGETTRPPHSAAAAPSPDDAGSSLAVGNGAESAVQGLLAPSKPTQTKPSAPPAPPYPAKAKPVRVDINRATVTQLQALPGIGPTLAQRIVDYRKQHGPFNSVAELNNVKGIGEKKLADIKPWAYVGQ